MMRPLGLFLCLSVSVASSWADTCTNVKEFVPATTPSSEFELTPEGTAIHLETGLEWMRCSMGQRWNGTTCLGEPTVYSWRLAVKSGDELTFANHSDWRLPEQAELESIIERRCFSPAINEAVFPNTTSNWYWSSTLDPYHSFLAWYVTFFNGRADSGFRSDANGRVRLVRGGPMASAP
jgi:hypothetical protein